MRVGIGFDVHKFVLGRPLVLGGARIPYPLGLEGHSDADVLTHAIIEALLGGASLGDLGDHFPEEEEKYKDISSLELLLKTKKILESQGYEVVNIDATVLLEEPKLAPFRQKMRKKVAETLNLNPNQISVKATTTEGLGLIGKKEGAACLAVALIQRVGKEGNIGKAPNPKPQ